MGILQKVGILKEKENEKRKREKVYALGQYIPMSADKARRVIEQIHGRSYEEALMVLELMPYRAAYPIFKLVYSAAANASHNKGFNKAHLIIKNAVVNKGTTMKKLKPRARGRSYMIKKPTCHITILFVSIPDMKKYSDILSNCSKKERQEILSLARSRSRLKYQEFLAIKIARKESILPKEPF
uniref:Large ribosomal subunit protein uL22c n=1 Tax=Halophytum ameghinoi TaxID=124817 RepID=A0A411K419_9CARY|nr:ribosomal protein L22 [Halophytum ameghinoi]QBC72071.1 ribosomal protein L22 [Halophytum ameghinoi]